MSNSVATEGRAAGSAGETWERVAKGTFLFGHQSVGGNVLDGVRDLAAERGGSDLRIVPDGGISGPGLYGARIGENGSPASKLAAFERLVAAAPSSAVVLMKFCYVDVRGDTDADALFDMYRQTIDRIRSSRPDVRVVHVTLPLTVDRGLLFHLRTIARRKTSMRQLNAIRSRYNERLRATFAGEPIFDLAALESTDRAGRAVAVRFGGAEVPVLAREWTYDGGHLNDAGRRRIADSFLATLASV